MNRSFAVQRNAAFTLVEILVVVVILGIAAAVIVPQMGTRDDLRVDGARRMLMADLIYAQNRSITTQTRHYVVFNNATYPHTYRIVTGLATGTPNGTKVAHPVTHADDFKIVFGGNAPPNTKDIARGLEMVRLGDVKFEGNHNVLCFDELGVPYFYDVPTGTTTATSTSGGSKIEITCGTVTRTVTVEPYTGEVLAP